MNRRILVGLVLGLGAVVSCDGGMPDPANSTPVQQLEFDLTINQDRALFKEDGLEYQGSVGPYAVYKVTKQNPRLIGPYIDTRGKMVGYAMLCGANHYFTRDFNASAATMQLLGGHSGLETFVESEQQAMRDGNCTPPKDQFGSPIPDGGDSSGGSNGGGTNGGGGGGGGGGGTGGGTGGCNSPDGCPNGGGTTGGIGGTGGTGGSGSPGGSTGGGTGGSTGAGGSGGGTGGAGGCTSPDPNGCTNGGSTAGGTSGSGGSSGGDNSGGNVLIQRLNVSFGYAAPPRIGSTVLLRRVALTGARRHNGSHIIPNICCGGGQCTLGAVQ